jgi:hypothetical protein
MNTQENNKMIAEFMGGQYVDEYLIEFEDFYAVKEIVEDEYYYTNCFDSDNELQYHTSWDWLMPVVEKILNKSDDDELIERFYEIQNVIPNREATYKSVVEFINQYNKTK